MARRDNPYHGVLLYHKPSGLSSHEAVVEIRRAINQRRVGHTGTLDPLAEGLLVVCLGKATKITRFISDFDKTYEAEICFGQRSSTYDSEGIHPDQPLSSVPDMTDDEISSLLNEYQGRIVQKVPAYSAVRVNGRRLYQLARSGASVDPPEREIEIKGLDLLSYRKPRLRVRITCSSGTYIRSLAHDLGEKLGCGGYLSWLRRTAVDEMNVARALNLAEVKQYHEAHLLHQRLLSFDAVLRYSSITVSDDFKGYAVCGKALEPKDVVELHGSFAPGNRVVLKNTDGQVLAVGMAEKASDTFLDAQGENLFSYTRVLN